MSRAIGSILAAVVAIATQQWWYLAVIVASFAYSEYTYQNISGGSTPALARKQQTTTIRSGTASKKTVYGETQVGGVLAWLGSSGVDDEYAHMIIILAPHEIEEISTIWFDDKLATDFSSSHYRIKKHLGTPGQVADADLVLETTLDSSFRLQGMSYIYVRFKFDRDVWVTGLPRNIKALIKGKKLYDPRDIGQDSSDSTTWLWSDNWGLVMRDFITSEQGMNATDTEIGEADIIAAANISDEQVIKYDGSYQARYTVNGTVDSADNLADNRDALATAGAGYAAIVEGKIKVISGVYTPPVSRPLTDDDLRSSIKIRPRTPRQELFNSVKGVFMGPSTGYQITEFPEVTNSFYETKDNGERISTDIELQFCDDPDRCQRLAKLYLDKARQPIILDFPGGWGCFGYTLGDCVNLSLLSGHASPIFDNKEFKIIRWALADSGEGIDLTLKEESSAAYDWNQGDATLFDTAPDTSLPSIFTPPPNVGNIAVTEDVYFYRLRSFTRITINFDPPTGYPYFSHIEVQHSVDGVNYKQLADQKSSFTMDPVSEGETHYFRLRSVSTAGVRTEDSQAYLLVYTVAGHIASPGSLADLSAIVNANTINLYAAKIVDPDVEIYEFRMGAFNTGVFLAAMRSPNLSLYGVKPGNFTFSCNTLSNNGQYGPVPRSAYASLLEPPSGWTIADSVTYDYSTGTHLNTEQTTYDADFYLKCSHNGIVLNSNLLTYSEEFDVWSGPATVTPNTDTAPDGTLTADTIEDTDNLAWQYKYKDIASYDVTKTYTLSVFIKKDAIGRATRFPQIAVQYLGSTTETSHVNLDTSTGEFVNSSPDPAAVFDVEDYNAEYWRVKVTATSQDVLNTFCRFVCYPAVGASATWAASVAATGSIVVWGAQVEEGVLSTYMPSIQTFISRASIGTYCDSFGILQTAPVDVERITYNPEDLTAPPYQLFENESTNELTYSEEFDNATWIGPATVTPNTDTAPDGTLTADTLADTDASATQYKYKDIASYDVTKTYTLSVFVKKDAVGRATRFSSIKLQYLGSTSESNFIQFDTSSGEFVNSSPDPAAVFDVEDYNAEYWRIKITAISQDPLNTSCRFQITPARGASATWAASVAATGSIVAWGAQVEPLSFATSYIPTVATPVTRAADIYTSAGGQIIETDLVGKYTSPEYDIGTVANRLFYALADTIVVGTGTTWNSKFSAGKTWNEQSLGTKSWRGIFELSEAPKVKMALLYGETSPPTSRADKMEILSTVITGRYFQLEIEIEDPIAGMNALVETVQLKFATRV